MKIKTNVVIDGVETKLNVPLKKATEIQTKAKIAQTNFTAEDLELRLLIFDSENDEQQMLLTIDIVTYITKLLRKKNKKKALVFLNKNKDRFNPELKDLLTSTIQENK